MRKKQNDIPEFHDEDEEREFWQKHSPLDYLDKKDSIVLDGLPNLKPSTEQISLRMAKIMLNRLKVMANRKDIPYQSLAKIYIERGIRVDMGKKEK